MNQKVIGYILNEQAMEPFRPRILEVTPEKVRFQSRLQEIDEENRNGRSYGEDIMLPALASDYINERIRTRTWYGEAGHPDAQDLKRQLKYDHTNLSHINLGYEVNNKVITGIVETAATSVGKDMRGLIVENNSLVAFSSRGYGPVTKDRSGKVKVAKPYTLFCYDWVVHPSHKNSYMMNVEGANVNESVEIEGRSNEFLAPISKADLRRLIVESRGLNESSSQLAIELGTSYLKLSPRCDSILIKENNGSSAVFSLDESLQNDINDFLLRNF